MKIKIDLGHIVLAGIAIFSMVFVFHLNADNSEAEKTLAEEKKKAETYKENSQEENRLHERTKAFIKSMGTDQYTDFLSEEEAERTEELAEEHKELYGEHEEEDVYAGLEVEVAVSNIYTEIGEEKMFSSANYESIYPSTSNQESYSMFSAIEIDWIKENGEYVVDGVKSELIQDNYSEAMSGENDGEGQENDS